MNEDEFRFKDLGTSISYPAVTREAVDRALTEVLKCPSVQTPEIIDRNILPPPCGDDKHTFVHATIIWDDKMQTTQTKCMVCGHSATTD